MAIAEQESAVRSVETFHYEKPLVGEEKISLSMVRSPRGSLGVQALNNGGENNLHAHPHGDGFWFVLKGRARFYTVDDRLVAEVGENEGILTPRGYPYWFEFAESPNGDDLEVIRFGSSDLSPDAASGPGRVNYEPLKANQNPELHPSIQGTVASR